MLYAFCTIVRVQYLHQQLERKRLADERESLYNELKRDKAASADGLRSSLFMQFGLEKQKKRKLKLVSMLWEVRYIAMYTNSRCTVTYYLNSLTCS